MISYLSGDIIFRGDHFIILDVNSVGYKVFVSGQTLATLPKNKGSIKLFCHLYVREDAMDLYGFFTLPQLNLFETLIGISGIGPKAAVQLASIGSVEDFKKAILEKNEKFFAGIHGIGKKKVQKIILELTGKIEQMEDMRGAKQEKDKEVIDALTHLGFSRQQAKEALAQIPQDTANIEEKIRQALKAARR